LIKNKLQLDEVGVIIPTFNEAQYLKRLITSLKELGLSKICIVDAESADETVAIAKEQGLTICYSTQKNRAFQLNLGARQFETEFYLFIHADVCLTELNESFFLKQINSTNFSFGNFKLQFDSEHWFLKLNEKFSHLKVGAFQFGDQGLLVKRRAFEAAHGYDEKLLFMEGNDIVRRLRKGFKFHKMDSKLLVSARKYEEIGVYRLQFSYFLIYFLARLGVSQVKLKKQFKRVLGS